MMMFAIVMPILLIIGILTIMMVVKSMGNVRVKKKFHHKLIIGYLALLVIVLIVAEIMVQNHQMEPPPTVTSSEAGFDLRYAIDQGAPIPERLIAAQRTHEVEGEFSLPKFYRHAYILIERTPEESNTIEETVYKPELLTGFDESGGIYYDLSDQLQIELPIWDSHSMSVPKQPINKIQYTFYHDSNMLNQFTGVQNHGYSSGMGSGVITIHLVIPESVELDIQETGDEYGDYIEFL
ncbi:hypothetical protein [Sporosarcina newyorkensis]|uniref:hypothetical protein n=1 Tax=Sporosarcina newyorkensis TaxID=759851 RepID=UPI003D06794E